MGTIYRNGKVNTIIKNGKIYGYASGGGGTEILSGTTNPTSAQGNNGQIYLKYSDLANEYTFKEYIEVGNTAGAYINTELRFTYGSEFEIDCQWTATPANTNGYAFGAWTSMQDTFVGFRNGNTFNYAVGGVHNNTAGDFQRHVFKATHTKMYIDNVEQTNSPNWSSVSSASIGIFIISNNTSYLTNNCKIYYIKMWDNDLLSHYFVPVERKSDNEAGMLDIITGIFYDNDGTQSFTVGGTPSITFDYPILNTYLKVNNTWQNLIGSDIDDVGNASETVTYIDMSDITVYKQSSMYDTPFTNLTVIGFYSSAIGNTFYYTNAIDVTNIDKIYYDLQTGTCYDGTQCTHPNWNLMIGLKDTAPTEIINDNYSGCGFAIGHEYTLGNTKYDIQELDVSNLTGNYYLVVNAHGWNAIISNLRYE